MQRPTACTHKLRSAPAYCCASEAPCKQPGKPAHLGWSARSAAETAAAAVFHGRSTENDRATGAAVRLADAPGRGRPAVLRIIGCRPPAALPAHTHRVLRMCFSLTYVIYMQAQTPCFILCIGMSYKRARCRRRTKT